MYYILRLLVLITFLSYTIPIDAQDRGTIDGVDARLFSIVTTHDTIDFIKLDAATTFKKPLFIMLQGSLPIPLVIHGLDRSHLTSFPYSIEDIKKKYHIINISMPHIPVAVDGSDIKSNGSMREPPLLYNKNNYLSNYVRRTNAVIDHLRSKIWVDTSKIVLFGHSQGAYVSIKVAGTNPHISHLGISGFSPFGRYDQHIRGIRMKEHQGRLSPEEAQAQINMRYNRWAYYAQYRDDDSAPKGDTNKATFSFSEDFIDDLLRISIPMHIMYGSMDIGAIGCDYLPIPFERAGKDNYQISVFPGLGHNFEEVDSHGNSNYDEMHWQKAMDSFIDWITE